MKVKVHARLLPSRHADIDQPLQLSQLTHPFLTSVLGPEKRNSDVYRTIAITGDLVNKFLSGFHASLIVFGESGSGKSYTLGLERQTFEEGFLLSFFSDTFGTMRGRTARFEMTMTELYSETFRDLFRPQDAKTTSSEVIDVEYDMLRGPYMRNLTRVAVESRDQCRELFLEGLERRRNDEREFGLVRHFSTLILTVHMSQLGVSSTFSMFCLAGAERLVASSETIRLHEGPHLSHSILKFERLVNDLCESMSSTPRQVVRYDDSKLTQLLVDVLGGNSVTYVLCTLKPQNSKVSENVLRIAQRIAQIENFPIENTEDAKQLVAQYRTAVEYYKTEHSGREREIGPSDSRRQESRGTRGTSRLAGKDHTLQLEKDVVKLREGNMRLEVTVGRLRQQYDEMSREKTKISSELIESEEEKMKLAQTLIDMQLEKNQSEKEALERQHQLETEILQLKNETEILHEDIKKSSQAAEDAEMKRKEMEVDKQELRDEHIALNAGYVSIREKLQAEQRKNEELGMEIINLVNAKSVLTQLNDQCKSEIDKLRAQEEALTSQAFDRQQYGQSAEHEVHKLQAAMNQSMSEAIAVKMDMVQKVTALEGEKRELEKQVLDLSAHQNSDLYALKTQYEQDIRKREEQIRSSQTELFEARKALRKTKQKLEATSEELVSLSSVKAEKAQLENKLTHLMDEFRQRLERYIQDLTKFVSGMRGYSDGTTESSLKHFIEAMFSDIRATHENRAHELEKQNKEIKQTMNTVAHRHNQLRSSYKLLQETLSDMGVEASEPHETEFSLPSGFELESSGSNNVRELQGALEKTKLDLSAAKEQSLAAAEHHRRVVHQMQQEMAKIVEGARSELDRKLAMSSSSKDKELVEQQKTISELQSSLASESAHRKAEASLSRVPGLDSYLGRSTKPDKSFSDLRRQLKEFTATTQHELEMERTRLKTQLVVAEEELARYKEFVANRLTRLYIERGSTGLLAQKEDK
ncbi:kinesin-like protein KIF3A isoform X2 [Corticium candelabrum]|uniref:kinesin-like protein KIF3A isoform X2 n=1 Tax=Corticium candelabrum TaxID=121492 RepID=UPI002E2712C4|nr:kinesin-like protein KIF3A isoform X2 [Corticium candelabrum]